MLAAKPRSTWVIFGAGAKNSFHSAAVSFVIPGVSHPYAQ